MKEVSCRLPTRSYDKGKSSCEFTLLKQPSLYVRLKTLKTIVVQGGRGAVIDYRDVPPRLSSLERATYAHDVTSWRRLLRGSLLLMAGPMGDVGKDFTEMDVMELEIKGT